MEIVIYSKDGCPFCSLLKMELSKRGFSFTEYNLSDDSIRAEFYEKTGTASVPQLFLTAEPTSLTTPSGQRIGGWSDVSADWQVLDLAADSFGDDVRDMAYAGLLAMMPDLSDKISSDVRAWLRRLATGATVIPIFMPQSA